VFSAAVEVGKQVWFLFHFLSRDSPGETTPTLEQGLSFRVGRCGYHIRRVSRCPFVQLVASWLSSPGCFGSPFLVQTKRFS